ncbi:Swt1 family HEPN domain-containing protein [Bizionia sp.]|uniref:Swt1 family HEPN domain-containing protein n=1 Tax=Bizionia sp. TaxID=1954480 RepID=UPI003A93B7F3
MGKDMSKNKEEINLFIALGKFIEAMRLFISSELKIKYGESWEAKYCEKLLPIQKDSWRKSWQEGLDPIHLIDYGNLNSFAIVAKKEFFYKFFGKKSNNLPTIFNELAEVRNILAHYLPFDNDKAEKAFLHMIEIAKNLDMIDLENDIRKLKMESFYEVKNIGGIKIELPKIENTNKSNSKQRPKIKRIINLILNTTGIPIDRSNANLSTINTNGIYSVEPNLNRIKSNWHLILVNTKTKVIYVFSVPTNHSIYDKLYQRDDKDVYRLLFNVDDSVFTEKHSHIRFDQFLETQLNYEDDSLLFS